MSKKQYSKIVKEVLINKQCIQNKLNCVSIKHYSIQLRNRIAEDGIEMTPKEVEEYLLLMKSILDLK